MDLEDPFVLYGPKMQEVLIRFVFRGPSIQVHLLTLLCIINSFIWQCNMTICISDMDETVKDLSVSLSLSFWLVRKILETSSCLWCGHSTTVHQSNQSKTFHSLPVSVDSLFVSWCQISQGTTAVTGAKSPKERAALLRPHTLPATGQSHSWLFFQKQWPGDKPVEMVRPSQFSLVQVQRNGNFFPYTMGQ